MWDGATARSMSTAVEHVTCPTKSATTLRAVAHICGFQQQPLLLLPRHTRCECSAAASTPQHCSPPPQPTGWGGYLYSRVKPHVP